MGVNSEIIEDGVNGFLANTQEEWLDKLKLLMHDAELRQRLGAAGRKTVETRYSAAVHAPRVYEILQSVVARSGAHQKTTLENDEKGFTREDIQGI